MDLFVISGASGMTGSELSRQLLNRGEFVIGFDNFFASSKDSIADLLDNSNFHFYEYDLNCSAHMANIGREVTSIRDRFNRVVYINCAAVVHTEYFYRVNETYDTNVCGMRSFLEQALMVNADVFINCSTSEVYSMRSWADGGVCESDPVLLDTAEQSQRTSYASGKLMTEFFMADAVQTGLIRGCSIRFANVYSKNERFAKHVIPHILTNLEQTGSVTLLENSRINRRTFLHNIDSCSAVLALVDTPEALDGSVYNVATDEEVSILELVAICAEALGIDDPIIVFNGYRASDPERRLLNTEKILSRTSWRPMVSLREGIAMCVESMRGL